MGGGGYRGFRCGAHNHGKTTVLFVSSCSCILSVLKFSLVEKHKDDFVFFLLWILWKKKSSGKLGVTCLNFSWAAVTKRPCFHGTTNQHPLGFVEKNSWPVVHWMGSSRVRFVGVENKRCPRVPSPNLIFSSIKPSQQFYGLCQQGNSVSDLQNESAFQLVWYVEWSGTLLIGHWTWISTWFGIELILKVLCVVLLSKSCHATKLKTETKAKKSFAIRVLVWPF